MLAKGAYVIRRAKGGTPDILILASGSEVAPSIEAAEMLEADGIDAAVIDFPSWELFEAQPESYKKEVLPDSVTRRLVVEAGLSFGWERYIGSSGRTITMDRFGASAPYEILAEKFGFTPQNIADTVREYLGK
jgi:transketolase